MRINLTSPHKDSELPQLSSSKNAWRYKRGFAVIALLVFGLLGARSAQATAAVTTTTLVISPTTATTGTLVTFTATVSNGSAVKVGLVKFCETTTLYCMDAALIGTAQLTSAGTAILKTYPGLVPADRTYKAIFVGTTANATSTSSTVTLTMTGTYATTTTLATSGSAGNYTLTGTVVGTGFGRAAPTGSVSFIDTTNGTYVVASGALGSGTLAQSFGTQVANTTGTGPQSVAVGDFWGHGILDLVVANSGSNTVSYLKGSGTGTFAAKVDSTSVGTNPYAVAVGDFNGDGILDMVVADDSYSGKVDYLQGSGTGTFSAAVTTSTGKYPVFVAVGDFNRDGLPDVAVANSGASTVSVLLSSTSSPGSFTPIATAPAVLSSPSSLAVGDFNGDTYLDLVVGYSTGTQISILLGNSTGTFTTARTDITVGTTPISVAVGDFNGDGKPDIAVANNGSGTVGVLLGNGDGTFATQVTYAVGTNPVSVATGDFNQDGITDLVVTNEGASGAGTTVSVLLGNGNGTFQAAKPYTTGSGPYSVAVGDFNGDGLPDLAVTNFGNAGVGTTLSVLLGSVTQTVTASQSAVSIPGNGAHLIEASYPTDGNFTASASGTTSLTASKVTTTLVLSGQPTSSTYGTSVILVATLNPSTLGSLVATGLVTFKNGSATLGTAAVNSSGVAAFPIGTLPAGTNSLTAVYAGDTNYSGSSSSILSYVVTKAVLTVTANSLSTTYGTIPALTYTMTGFFNGDTQLGATAGGPTLSTTATMTSAPNTYPITLVAGSLAAANYTFTCVGGTLTVTQAPLTVTAQNASKVYDTANPAFTYTMTGFMNGQTQAIATTGAPTLSTVATTTSAAGNYAITAGVGTLTSSNYSFTLVNGTLTITKVPLTVTAFNASRVYGAANPTFTYVMTGFVGTDTQATATSGLPSLTTTAVLASPDGTYPITAALGTLTSTSYSFVFVNAVLTIDSTGTGTPNIQGRWEFAITSGDTPTQISQMGQSTISSYVMQSGTSLSIISAFNANTIACDTNAGSNASLSGSTIDSNGNVIINFTFTEPGSASFHVVFTGVLYTGTPTVITGTYQRTTGGCTMGNLGSGTPDGNFTATYFPDISGTLNGAFEAPDTGTGTGSTATFVLTTNADKSLSGTVTAAALKNASSAACFVSPVTLKAGMVQGTSQASGIGIELFGTDTNGTALWVNAYATNPDGSVAAVGEDNPADVSPSGTSNDGTNNAYTAFYGITGGPCDGEGGGDAPFIRVTNPVQPPRHHRAPIKRHHAMANHRFHALELRLQGEVNPRFLPEAIPERSLPTSGIEVEKFE
jgi:hypothetical protein